MTSHRPDPSPETQPHPLADAAFELLPQIQTVIATHHPTTAPHGGCPRCAPADRRNCPELELAAFGLDLIIRSWRLITSTQPNRR